MLNGTASGSRFFKQQDTQHGFFSTSTFSLKAGWIYLNQNIISNICLNIVEPIGYQRHTMSINPFKERLNSRQRLCVHFSRRHTPCMCTVCALCTVVNLALPHFSHHTKQMNDLSPDSNSSGWQKHCAMKLLTAFVLQFHISCLWLISTSLPLIILSIPLFYVVYQCFSLSCRNILQWLNSR